MCRVTLRGSKTREKEERDETAKRIGSGEGRKEEKEKRGKGEHSLGDA